MAEEAEESSEVWERESDQIWLDVSEAEAIDADFANDEDGYTDVY